MSKSDELWEHNLKHDCGIMIAQKKMLHRLLVSKLLTDGYDLTYIYGNYPEGSLFIADVKDKGSLEKDLVKLGIEFKQNIIFISKGTIDKPIIENVGDKLHYPATGFGVWAMFEFAKKSPQDLPD